MYGLKMDRGRVVTLVYESRPLNLLKGMCARVGPDGLENDDRIRTKTEISDGSTPIF